MTLLWVDRTFDFSFPAGMFPVILERVRGTPARLDEKLSPLDPATRTRREGESWSIQEHAGHLLDLDELHIGRLDDYEAGAAILRPADMTNRKTRDAHHNERTIGEILAAFRADRGRFVARLETWEESDLGRIARHPRLDRPMRVVDMAFFVAEHDDHHLARMTELARSVSAPARTP